MPSGDSPAHSRGALCVVCTLWGVLAVGGVLALGWYSGKSGAIGVVSPMWPDTTSLPKPSDRPTLVMFLHPRCPCSRASLEQLARIHSRCRARLAMHVVFYRPAHGSETWARTGLWELAGRIPGAELSVDPDGRTASKFGALTSGHVLVYDRQGRLLFSGGITAGRGHEGDNPGASAIIAIARGQDAADECARVFGCALHAPRPGDKGETAADLTTLAGGVRQ